MSPQLVWWAWPLAMLFFTFVIGVIAPISGVGGGVLFVPLTTAFFPFNIDFIRGTGLILALAGSLSSAPGLVRQGLASLRTMAPIAIVSITTSIIGSELGLWLTNSFPAGQHYITIGLGVILLIVFGIMAASKRVEFPGVPVQGPISRRLGLSGECYEPSMERSIEYKLTRARYGLPAFAVVGLIGGVFGMGGGWANVPVLNLIMGAPIKVATSTSMLIISANSASAAWIYLGSGAVLPLLIIPSVLGITLGARVGTRIAVRAKPRVVRYLVMGIMLISALLDMIKGLGGLGVIPKLF